MRDAAHDYRKGEYKEHSVQGLRLKVLRYVDHTVLLAKTRKGLRNFVNSGK